MFDSYIKFKMNKNIRPFTIPNKEQYYIDLLNIEDSWTGRIDANICNTFVMEAEQQLLNAIELFEQGYFDCAYYSLRSAVDLSTTMVFLSDTPNEERNKYFKAWKSTSDFPMQGQMVKALSKNGNIFTDMLKKMPSFFSNAKKLSAELNKFVHKQGFQHFYISRNHVINQNKSQAAFIKMFEHYLKRCIGVVAVMRLAIDPFPILLTDEEILYRYCDSMTEPYNDEFIEKYIGLLTIENYKQTDLYINTYNYFINKEKKNLAVFNMINSHYIDSKKSDEIHAQFHLLPKEYVICFLLVAANEKVVKAYGFDGLPMFLTDRKSKRKAYSWSGHDFKKFRENKDHLNQIYDEAFISVFVFDNTSYYIEHNQPIKKDEAKSIDEYVSEELAKINSRKSK